MKSKVIIFSILISLVMFFVFAIKNRANNLENSSAKISVMTTLFPLYEFAKEIGGTHASVRLLLPPGVESHSFEPKPNDFVEIDKSDIFIFTGKYMEPWVQDLISSINSQKVSVIDASSKIDLLKSEDGKSFDPHIWLDFSNSEKIVLKIRDELVRLDPKNQKDYQKNAQMLITQLQTLDRDYKQSLSNCSTKTVVFGGHYAFGYLAKKYSLNYVAAQGLAPDSEPTAMDLQALISQIKNEQISTVFYEELDSPKIAEVLSSETSASLLPLSSAHNIPADKIQNNETFVSIMRQNLVNLKEGLGCK